MDAWEKLVFVVFVCLAAAVVAVVFSLVFADGKIDYCKILYSRDSVKNYELIGHRPWVKDEVIASNLETFEDAVGKAQQISCEIH